MLLKVGDLAKRCGLTVRMLHHYDSIGLLTPSARSDSGYRLYDKADIARLHQIQALRRFGMSLADVGAFLASPGVPLTTIMERQIAMLDQQITQASVLRDRLMNVIPLSSLDPETGLATDAFIAKHLETLMEVHHARRRPPVCSACALRPDDRASSGRR